MIFSIVFEQIGTGFLEACQAFTKLTPTLCLIGAYIVSYWLFARALGCINLSIFYATWTAAGTVSAALIGIFILVKKREISQPYKFKSTTHTIIKTRAKMPIFVVRC